MLQGRQNLVHAVLHERLSAGRPLEKLVTILLTGPLQGAMMHQSLAGIQPPACLVPLLVPQINNPTFAESVLACLSARSLAT